MPKKKTSVQKKSIATKKVTKKVSATQPKKKVAKKPIKTATKQAVKKAAVKTPVKKAPAKKASVSKIPAKKNVKKSVKKPAAKKVTKKISISQPKKKTVKKVVAARTTQKAPRKVSTPVSVKKTAAKVKQPSIAVTPAPIVIKPTPPSITQQDIAKVSKVGTDLDMIVFKNVTLENTMLDLVYSSDNVAVLCKVISDEHSWTVDTSKPIRSSVWQDESGKKHNPCIDLLNQVAILKRLEPDSTIIPALILMRGSVNNADKVSAYLARGNVRLVKYNATAKDGLQDLYQLLKEKFSFELPDLMQIEAPEKKISKESKAPTPSTEVALVLSKKSDEASKRKKFLASLATLGSIGYFPKGPGTMGSLVALPIAYVLNRFSLPLMWFVTLGLLTLGFFAVHQFTNGKKERDPSCVIIDEVVGQLITFFVVLPDFMHWPILLLGFMLFRFFDIFKFGPVAFWDRRKNPIGVMMDDVMAGIFAGFILAMLQVTMIQCLSY